MKDFISTLQKCRTDLNKKYIESILIDEEKYYDKYPDVKNSGISAAEHYFTYGYEENRELFTPTFYPPLSNHKNPHRRKTYLSNSITTNASFMYRCLFIKKENDLAYSGNAGIHKWLRAIFNSQEIIFSRPEDNELNSYYFKIANAIGVNISLDYDDLLLPEYSAELGHVRSGYSKIGAAHLNTTRKIRWMHYANKVYCSTPKIADELSSIFPTTEVICNKLPKKYFIKEEKLFKKTYPQEKTNILYMSGSATHKRDMSICLGALYKIAQTCPEKIKITLLGDIGFETDYLKNIGVEIKRLPKLNFESMLDAIYGCDVCLVPLEKTNFNNAKSNIKFIECGAQGVPVIASKTDEFKNSIINGFNGWLCNKPDDWLVILNKIINNKIDLKTVGKNAYKTTKANFSI